MNIYIVTCLVNGKVYIGQEKVESRRWKYHVKAALSGEAYWPFHRAIAKYGVENFVRKTVSFHRTQPTLDTAEIKLIKLYKATKRRYGYNLMEGGSGWGGHSKSSRKKISKKKKEWWERQSEEERREFGKRVGAANKGKTLSKESRLKVSRSSTGKKKSKEHCRHISEGRKGIIFSESHCRNISKANKGRKKGPFSESHCQNISKARVAYFARRRKVA